MLNLNAFLVRERIGMLRLVEVYDIYDPETGSRVAVARETLPFWIRVVRLFAGRHAAPTAVTVAAGEESGCEVFFTFRKPLSLIRARIAVRDASGALLGTLVSKVLTIGGGFHVLDPAGNRAAEVKGDWIGWNFTVVDGAGMTLGTVTKKWAGIGRELFTSADNYFVRAEGPATADRGKKILILAVALATDMVFKEGRR